MPQDSHPDATDALRLLMRRGSSVGAAFELALGETTLGRRPESGIRLDGFKDFLVSGRHARIVRTVAGCRLEDSASTNGTWLNGTRLAGAADLHDGDRITLGDPDQEGAVEFVFEWPGGPVRTVEPQADTEGTRDNANPRPRHPMASGRSSAVPPTKASPALPPLVAAPPMLPEPVYAEPVDEPPRQPGDDPAAAPGVLGRIFGKMNRVVNRFTEGPKLKKRIAELRARDSELMSQAGDAFAELGAALRSARVDVAGFEHAARLEAVEAALAECASAQAELEQDRRLAQSEAAEKSELWQSRRDAAASRARDARDRHEAAAARLTAAQDAVRRAAGSVLEELAALARELAMSAREDAEHLPDDLPRRHPRRLADACAHLARLELPPACDALFAARSQAAADADAAEAEARSAGSELAAIEVERAPLDAAAAGRAETFEATAEALLRDRLPKEHEARGLLAELGFRAMSMPGACPEDLPQTARARALQAERAALATEIESLEAELRQM